MSKMTRHVYVVGQTDLEKPGTQNNGKGKPLLLIPNGLRCLDLFLRSQNMPVGFGYGNDLKLGFGRDVVGSIMRVYKPP
jgi:hypothetical protein